MAADQEPVHEYRMRQLRNVAAWEEEWSTYERYFRERRESALLLQSLSSASPPKWLLYIRGEFDREYYSKPAALRALRASRASDDDPLGLKDISLDTTDGVGGDRDAGHDEG